MFYTILGGVLGCGISYVLCRLTNVSFKSRSGGFLSLPSDGAILTALGTLCGSAAGFGYGAHALYTGSHAVVNIVKK